MWEMNLPAHENGRPKCYDPGSDLPRNRFAPQPFVAAWNHIHQIFVAEGATNVIWFWCPSKQNNPMAYYPGSDTVDWAGFDAYNRHGQSIAETFEQIYSWESGLGKPLVIGETASQPELQGAFFQNLAQTLRTQFPLVKGVVYFDAPGNVGGWTINDISGFGKMANDPYFAGKLQSSVH